MSIILFILGIITGFAACVCTRKRGLDAADLASLLRRYDAMAQEAIARLEAQREAMRRLRDHGGAAPRVAPLSAFIAVGAFALAFAALIFVL